MKILLEMRPAFDGHSGIPQETRLLFRGLGGLPMVAVVGLIQSSNLPLQPGLVLRRGEIAPSGDAAKDLGQLSKVVVSLQQGPASHRIEHLRNRLLAYIGPTLAVACAGAGRKLPLTGFDPAHFKDFIWRALFAKSLPPEDLDAVTAGPFRVCRWPWSAFNVLGVTSAMFGRALYPRLDTAGVDVMIAETPYPGRVSRPTRMIVRYHDAIPLLMPHTIKNRGMHRATHFHALKRNADDGAWFACVSEATRQDLLSAFPRIEARTVTIPNMISHHFAPEEEPAGRVPEIVWSRKNRNVPHHGGAAIAAGDLIDGELPYLLMVSTIEPRKNHLGLIDAWELLRSRGFPKLNLVCVGGLGWEHEAILRRFAPWFQRGGVHLLEDVPSADLRLLYRHARATVCPSWGEGFDFAGVEAMRSGGLVAASDIRVHREVYGDAAEYFGAYDPVDMAAAISRVIDPVAELRRQALRERSAQITTRYLPEQVLPQWQRLLERVVG